MAMSQAYRPTLFAVLLLAAFFFMEKSALSMTFVYSPNSTWVLPAITLYACSRWGWKIASALGVVITSIYWLTGFALPDALSVGIGIVAESLLGAILVKRFLRGPHYFLNINDIFHFVWIAALCSAVIASVNALFLTDSFIRTDLDLTVKWVLLWLEGVAGLIIFAPMFFAVRPDQAAGHHRSSEILFFAVALPIVTHISFGDVVGQLPLAFLPLGFVLWAALRFSPVCVSIATATVCLIAIYDTSMGLGPFSRGHFDHSEIPLMLLLTYVGIVQIFGLSTSSLLYQHKHAKDALERERDDLERQVNVRTQELRFDIEQRERVEAILRDKEIQLAEAQHLANMGSWNKDMATGVVTWSDELYQIYESNRDSAVDPGIIFSERIHPDDFDQIHLLLSQAALDGKPFRADHRILLSDGKLKIVATRTFPVMGEASGKIVRLFGTVQDVTERRQTEKKLMAAEQRYRQVVELSPEPIFIVQEDRIVLANKSAATFVGTRGPEDLYSKPIVRFFAEDNYAALLTYIARLERGDDFDPLRAQLTTMDGEKIEVEIRSSTFVYDNKPAEILIMHDITERLHASEKLARLAHYDSLTDLPNRILFNKQLEHAIGLAGRHGTSVELMFVDVDKFKQINDTFGHAAGDQVLKELAIRMRGALRETDTAARLAGDEFVVLLEGSRIDKARGGSVARKILNELARPVLFQNRPIAITVSIGISRFPHDALDADSLLERADQAMYRAKEAGRSDYRFFSPETEYFS
jgi:diguanylate cyclase (GGDEF)-like protein/PAS domain S-box-containing protein